MVTSPADCMFRHCFDIDEKSNIPATLIKGTHRYGNIEQLMEGSRYAEAFAGGNFVHYMLPPSAYHRYHVPVAGRVEESFVISGKVYMEVDLEDHQLQSKDSAQSGYEFTQVRGVLTLDTSSSVDGDIGMVAVIPVGMSHVASVNLTAVPRDDMSRRATSSATSSSVAPTSSCSSSRVYPRIRDQHRPPTRRLCHRPRPVRRLTVE